MITAPTSPGPVPYLAQSKEDEWADRAARGWPLILLGVERLRVGNAVNIARPFSGWPVDGEFDFQLIPETVPVFDSVVLVHLLRLYPIGIAARLLQQAKAHTRPGGQVWVIERDALRIFRRYGEGAFSSEEVNSFFFPDRWTPEDASLSLWDGSLLTMVMDCCGLVDCRQRSDLDFPYTDMQDCISVLASGMNPGK